MRFEKWFRGALDQSAAGFSKQKGRRVLKQAIGPVLEVLERRQMLTAVVTTDQADYAPGSTAVFTAASDGQPTHNFLAGETIQFHVERTDGVPINSPPALTDWQVIDGVGGFTPYQNASGMWVYPDNDGLTNGSAQTNWYVDPQFAGASLMLTATGLTSGETAQAAFTDASDFVVSGTVINDTNGNGAVDAGEVGLANATINIYSDSTHTTKVAGPITSAADGSWTSGSLGKGLTLYVVETPPTNFGATNAIPGSGNSATKDSNTEVHMDDPSSGGSHSGVQFLNHALATTTTTLTRTAGTSPSTYGNSLTFHAAVTGSGATGTVQFKVGGVNLGSAVTLSSGFANLTISTIGVGASQQVTAVYSGDGTFASSTSAALSQTVNAAPLTIIANSASKTYGQTTTFTGTAFTSSGLQNGETIGSVTLASTGAAATAAVSGSPYSIVASAATGGTFTAGNYNITYTNGTLTVSAAALTITANADTKTYGQTKVYGAGQTTFVSSGLQNSETVGSVTITASGGTTANAAVGGYTLTPSAATGGSFNAGNYSITYSSGTLTVNKLAVTLIGSRTYDGTTGAAAGILTISNNIDGANLTLSGSGILASKNVGPEAVSAGTLALGGSAAGNYTLTGLSGSVTVSAAALTLTANADSKTYGQTKTYGAGSSAFTPSGLQNGETIGSVTLSSSGTAASANVAGSPYTITASAATGGSFTPSNYTITYAAGALTVNTAHLTVTANPQSRTYGAANPTLTATLSGFVNGETPATSGVSGNANVSTSATTTSSVGGYAITPALGTLTAGNYDFTTFTPGTLTINPYGFSYLIGNDSHSYGSTANLAGDLGTTIATGINGENLGIAYASTGNATSATVGGYDITGSLGDGTGLLSNYHVTLTHGTLTVGTKALTVTANSTSKTYGQTVTFAGTEFGTSGLINGDTVTNASLTSGGAAATASVVGSPYAIVPSAAAGSGLGNYSITYANGSLVVNKAALTVTADAQSKVYGGADPTLTYSVSGTFYNGDTASVVSGVSLATTTGAAATAGTHTITATGGTAANYNITDANGTLTVTKASLTATADNQSKTYGAADPTLTYTPSGMLFYGDSYGVVTGVSLSTTTGSAATAGTHAITATGGTAANYNVTDANGTLNVSKAAALTVTADNQSKTYGGTDPALTYTPTGTLYYSDGYGVITGVSLSSLTGAAATAGTHTITASGGTASNYNVTDTNGTLTVAKAAALTVTADNQSKVYGDVDPALTYTPSGTLYYSDGYGVITGVNLSTAIGAAATAGTHAIAASGGLAANYDVADVNGTLSVGQRAVTATADAKSKLYGAADPALTYQVTQGSLVYGDSFSGSLSRVSGETAGNYAIQQNTLSLNGNYVLSFVGANLTITKASVSAVSVKWGSRDSGTLVTQADGLRLLPTGRATDIPWAGVNRIQITLSGAVALSAVDVSVSGIAVANYGPVTVSGSGGVYTITLAQAIAPADRVTVTIGNAGVVTYTRRLDVLTGDANDDGVVNSSDMVIVRNMTPGYGGTPTIFGDINGDNVWDSTDYNLVRQYVGRRLP